MATRRNWLLSLVAVALAGGSLCGCSPAKAAKRPEQVRPFTLTDQHGQTVTERTFLGKPTAFFFGFTYCPEVCPTTLASLTRWMQALGPKADRLNVVYVTIDPERDTPKQMALYLSAFDPRIHGLSGTLSETAKIAKEFRVFYQKVPLDGGGYSMAHSTAIYLMDSAGQLRDVISYEEKDKDAVAQLEALIRSN